MVKLVPPEICVKVLRLHTTVKSVVLVAVPPFELTVMGPVVAPEGTVVVMVVAVAAVITEKVPLNLTVLFAIVVLKFAPVIVTVIPAEPEVGVKLAMVGAGAGVSAVLQA